MKDANLRRTFRRVCQKNGIKISTDINQVFIALIDGEDAFKIFKLGVRHGFETPDPEDDLLNRMVEAASEIEE